MSYFETLVRKLFTSAIFNQNTIITAILLILVGLNLLGIDLDYMSQSTYVIATLVIIDILITIFVYPLTTMKLNTMTVTTEKLEELSSDLESTIDSLTYIKNKIVSIEKRNEEISMHVSKLNEELKDLPNIRALKLVLSLRSKSLWNDLFIEALKYILTFSDESANIMDINIRNSFEEYQIKYIEFIHNTIISYDIKENLTELLNFKINNSKELILSELNKTKKIEEKLYIISLLLKSLDEDLNSEIINYLRNMQANLL